MEITETELDAIKQQYFMSGYEAGKKDALEGPEEMILVPIRLLNDLKYIPLGEQNGEH